MWIERLKRGFWFLGSLRFAVIVISVLAVVSIWGTLVESKYDAETAQTLIYRSIYMWAALIGLAISLIVSALERIPWKKKHIPFLVAHIGLLMILAGSVLTQRYGLDGSLSVNINDKSGWVSVGEKEIAIYATQDGVSYAPVARKEVEFLKTPPTHSDAFVLKSHDAEWRVVDFAPYAYRQVKIVESQQMGHGPAIRFQVKNDRVDVSDWLLQRSRLPATYNFGPAKLYLVEKDIEISDENAIVLQSVNGSDTLNYKVFSKRKGKYIARGKVKQGESFSPGWMGLEFRLLKYLPKAKEDTKIIKKDYPTAKTTSAILIKFQDIETWLELNASMKFFTETTAYVLSYGNVQLGLGFDLFLNQFAMETYPGTSQAASYESIVSVPGIEKHKISMNEPLEYKGYTIYQASYTTDPNTMKPIASIFSVNYDPGRSLKYWGSLLVVFGSVLLFYFRKYYLKKKV